MKRSKKREHKETCRRIAAKREKNQNESRIRYLERILKFAKVISTESRSDEVGINDTISLYFLEDQEEEVYRLVTSIRGQSLDGKISNISPLGKAIMGRKQGEIVEVKPENGISYSVEIRKIEKTGEKEEESIRKF